jgi:CRISPR system Cascade subunit CasC
MTIMFLQIHTLTSYAAALLNRDDAGLAKRIPFGNAERMRVSSQCLKKHWRDELHRVLDLPGGIRSRMFFEREILRRVMNEHSIPENAATKMVTLLMKELITSKEKEEKAEGKKEKGHPLHLKQPLLLGKPEADYFVRLLGDCAKTGVGEKELKEQLESIRGKIKDQKQKTNLRQMMKAAGQDDLASGIEGAMFGRFVTSDILARTDAAVHVAHAFTVHPLSTEVDFFTVVDDLKEAHEDAGAAHAGDMELGAGLFYGYVVVDVPLLVSNLCGCDAKDWASQPAETLADARNVLTRLIDAIATVSPGAKLGSTAPYARAACVLLESGKSQPRTLANAYLKALKLSGDPMQQAVDALGEQLAAIDAMYGSKENRFVSSTQNTAKLASIPAAPLTVSVASVLDSIFGAG